MNNNTMLPSHCPNGKQEYSGSCADSNPYLRFTTKFLALVGELYFPILLNFPKPLENETIGLLPLLFDVGSPLFCSPNLSGRK